ncbi:tRNA-dihydrouridine synthase [uncultured Methanobrevibacter sp.]|uniref:oxidoreductase n=1 Tax=uncultured Methanobrevibacter sp. TaxID=253161 RepID=UPI00260CA45C
MKDIFDSVQLGDFELKSRIVRTGTWERQTHDGGFLDNEVFEKYEKIAKSGVGAINTEIFTLDPHDRFYEFTTNMNYKGFIKDYKEITDIAHAYNVPVFAQIAPFYYNDGLNQKVEANDISLEGIRHFQTDIIMAAKKLSFAGFDGIQLNMGNNFYLSRFINPYFNQRTDDYGGNTLNRTRMVLEIIKVIKSNYDLHITCRINPNDVRKGGITYDESIEIAKLLEKYGADCIQLTARTISYFYNEEGGLHPYLIYANRLIDELNIPVILGGSLRDMKSMNDILNSTNIELMSMSKPFVAQADFLSEWKANGEGHTRCQSCNNCYTKKSSTCLKY